VLVVGFPAGKYQEYVVTGRSVVAAKVTAWFTVTFTGSPGEVIVPLGGLIPRSRCHLDEGCQ